MTQVFTVTEEDLFNEIVEKGQLDLVSTKEAYDMLVEEVVQDNIALGGLDIDQDTESIETRLKERFAQYEELLLAE